MITMRFESVRSAGANCGRAGRSGEWFAGAVRGEYAYKKPLDEKVKIITLFSGCDCDAVEYLGTVFSGDIGGSFREDALYLCRCPCLRCVQWRISARFVRYDRVWVSHCDRGDSSADAGAIFPS